MKCQYLSKEFWDTELSGQRAPGTWGVGVGCALPRGHTEPGTVSVSVWCTIESKLVQILSAHLKCPSSSGELGQYMEQWDDVTEQQSNSLLK